MAASLSCSGKYALYSVFVLSERRKGQNRMFCEPCLYVGVVVKSAPGQARENWLDIS